MHTDGEQQASAQMDAESQGLPHRVATDLDNLPVALLQRPRVLCQEGAQALGTLGDGARHAWGEGQHSAPRYGHLDSKKTIFSGCSAQVGRAPDIRCSLRAARCSFHFFFWKASHSCGSREEQLQHAQHRSVQTSPCSRWWEALAACASPSARQHEPLPHRGQDQQQPRLKRTTSSPTSSAGLAFSFSFSFCRCSTVTTGRPAMAFCVV